MDIVDLQPETFRSKYHLEKDGRDWKIITAKNDIKMNQSLITTINYLRLILG